MPDAFSAIIYGALLLSSRGWTGRCSSSRSVFKVVVGSMRGEHGLREYSGDLLPQRTRSQRGRRAERDGSAVGVVGLERRGVIKPGGCFSLTRVCTVNHGSCSSTTALIAESFTSFTTTLCTFGIRKRQSPSPQRRSTLVRHTSRDPRTFSFLHAWEAIGVWGYGGGLGSI